MGGSTSTPVASGKLSSSAQTMQQPVGTNPAQTYVQSNYQPSTQPAYNYFQNAHVTGPTDPRQITNFTTPINRAPLVAPPTINPISSAQMALMNMYGGGYGGGYNPFSGFNGYNAFAGGGKVDGDHHEKLIRLAQEILSSRGE